MRLRPILMVGRKAPVKPPTTAKLAKRLKRPRRQRVADGPLGRQPPAAILEQLASSVQIGVDTLPHRQRRKTPSRSRNAAENAASMGGYDVL